MELYKEILVKILQQQELQITFPNVNIDVNEIMENECYQALQKIKEIIQDDTLEDVECFMKIEEIVCLFEALGSNGGSRHDFG